ncbi:MAG: Tat-translocated enzyme [Actinomycetia bacterium]|nr:Tat-translocated enzyme [Actinomycetes bacterium]
MTDGPRFSRRRLLGGLGATALGAGALAVGGRDLLGDQLERAGASPAGEAVPFHGEHQAGIVTPAQDRLLFGAFDMLTDDRQALIDLLRAWTLASIRMTRGETVGPDRGALLAPPTDTGEAIGLGPAQLTITFGFGPSLFDLDGNDRFGIAANRPAQLAELPAFAFDAINPGISNGDLCVQVCADDPQVTFHALRNLTRIAKGVAGLRWSQLGFGRTSSTGADQSTPRNLMGFKDGTNNIRSDDEKLQRQAVWVQERDDPAWMRGGSYLVARRIRMLIEVWDRSSLGDQEATIGRDKIEGAPLGQKKEFDAVDLKQRGKDGRLAIPVNAHVRLAAPVTNGNEHMLRRGYSFTDGVDPRTAQLDAGLFFLAYQRDPRVQFVAVQNRLAASDALNEYIQHTASALFAVPPGVQPGGWIGETLFT